MMKPRGIEQDVGRIVKLLGLGVKRRIRRRGGWRYSRSGRNEWELNEELNAVSIRDDLISRWIARAMGRWRGNRDGRQVEVADDEGGNRLFGRCGD